MSTPGHDPKLIVLRLSDAAQSALQCLDGGGLDPLTDRAWDRRATLAFRIEDADEIASEILEAMNSAGDQVEYRLGEGATGEGRRALRRAESALRTLADKINRAAAKARAEK